MHPASRPLLAALVIGVLVIAARAALATPAGPPRASGPASADDPPGAGTHPLEVVSEDAQSRTVRHTQGVSVIPRHPQRVAVLGWSDEIAALGIEPVAASGDGRGAFPAYLKDRLGHARVIDASGGSPDLEALVAARPDVIVAAWLWTSSYPALSRIAPTVVLQTAQWEWRQRFRDLALAVDRTAAGETRLQQLQERIDAARVRLHDRLGGASVAMVRVFAREFRLYGRDFSGPLLYEDLGLTPPQLVTDLAWRSGMVRLSLEGLCRLDADHLLLMTEETLPVSFQVRDHLEAHPLWRQLRAVADGHVHEVPNPVMRGGIINRELMIDTLVQALAP